MTAALLLVGLPSMAGAMPERIMVAPETAPCTGVGKMECLQLKQPGELDWRLHYGGIEGFRFEPGVAWVLLVDERRVENPPADAPSRVLALKEVVGRQEIPPHPAGQLESLRGSGWRLARVDPVGSFDDSAWRSLGATLIFDKERLRIGGRGGCNRWFGSWSLEPDGTMKASPFGSTQMACPGQAMAMETAYLDLLSHPRRLRWWGTEVEVESADGTRLLFEQLLE